MISDNNESLLDFEITGINKEYYQWLVMISKESQVLYTVNELWNLSA